MRVNANMANMVKGFVNPIDLTTGSHKEKIRRVRDALTSHEASQSELRLFTDKMDPAAMAGIYVILTALEGAIADAP